MEEAFCECCYVNEAEYNGNGVKGKENKVRVGVRSECAR